MKTYGLKNYAACRCIYNKVFIHSTTHFQSLLSETAINGVFNVPDMLIPTLPHGREVF